MDFEGLKSKINNLTSTLDGDVSLVLKYLDTNQTFCINENFQFWAASVIKIPIAAALYDYLPDKDILDEKRCVKKENIVKGSGIVHLLDPNNQYTTLDLIKLMIILSDNVATNELVDIMGWEAINSFIKKIGLKNTTFKHKMQIKAGRGPNLTTAHDMCLLLDMLHNNKLKGSRQILEIMKETKLRDRIPALLPNDIDVAHKTGSLLQAVHNIGIVYSKNPFILTFLSDDQKNKKQTKETIAEIAKICFDYSQNP